MKSNTDPTLRAVRQSVRRTRQIAQRVTDAKPPIPAPITPRAREPRITTRPELLEEATTDRLPTPGAVAALKRSWLRMPSWDIEFAEGFEQVREELARWHDEQVRLRARAMGCTYRQACAMEDFVRAWMTQRPPRNLFAWRVLLEC